jgi:hypothetical protein
MKEEKKIIMYDSPEAASIQTLTGWVSGPNGGYKSHYWGEDEHQARWSGCTHIKCECGKVREKAYTCCEDCRNKNDRERHLKLPFKEWDGKEPVTEAFGDRYFFNLEDLEEYMAENEIEEIDLLICDPVHYSHIDSEYIVNGEAHEDWEPSGELENKIKELNDYLSTLPPHSWYPGKIRTTHKINLADFKEE